MSKNLEKISRSFTTASKKDLEDTTTTSWFRMHIALTGTPGIGKTSVSAVLRQKGFKVVDINNVAVENNFFVGVDKERDSKIADVDKIDDYIKKHYSKEDMVFFDSHLSHLLKSVERVIVFRCHPDNLAKRLSRKRWKKEKIKENIEAEMLDVILCETLEYHSKQNVFEIDTTNKSIEEVASSVMKIIENKFKHRKKYKIGNIDWSEEILRDF